MIVLSVFLLSTLPSFAHDLSHHAQGWHWYEVVRQEEEKQDHQALDSPDPSDGSRVQDHEEDPVRELTDLKKRLETLKARAVMRPTFAHVRAYMDAQAQMMVRATAFSHMWQKVLAHDPRLDASQGRPFSKAGRLVLARVEREALVKKIKALSRTHGLFFFFSSSCSWCHAMAPIVKRLSEMYGWEVLPISLDGGGCPEFPHVRTDNGAARSLGIQTLPALMAVCPEKEKVIPLAYGFQTLDQIEEKIRLLVEEQL